LAATDQIAAAKTENDETIARFENYIEQTRDLFRKICSGINTQLCESFHARKAIFSCKDIACRASWQARIAAAVLDMNESDWRLQLYERLGLPKLHPSAVQIIH
jgi:hypothetical protein